VTSTFLYSISCHFPPSSAALDSEVPLQNMHPSRATQDRLRNQFQDLFRQCCHSPSCRWDRQRHIPAIVTACQRSRTGLAEESAMLQFNFVNSSRFHYRPSRIPLSLHALFTTLTHLITRRQWLVKSTLYNIIAHLDHRHRELYILTDERCHVCVGGNGIVD